MAAHGAVLPIEPEGVPSPPVGIGPDRKLRFCQPLSLRRELFGVRIFFREFEQPVVDALLLELVAKGGPQFFAPVPMNSASPMPTRDAVM